MRILSMELLRARKKPVQLGRGERETGSENHSRSAHRVAHAQPNVSHLDTKHRVPQSGLLLGVSDTVRHLSLAISIHRP
jgi:hypothetical protein